MREEIARLASCDRDFILAFSAHVWRFALEHNLLSSGAKLLVATSGGIDSMALLALAKLWQEQKRISEVRAIFVDHGSRVEQKADGELVKQYCIKQSISFVSKQIAAGLSQLSSNFEHRARELRYNELYAELQAAEKLVLAHHLDDSFEWSLLQQLRSANVNSSLGIPVKRGRIIRPFMSVSKNHIKRFVNLLKINYRDDPTNQLDRFERNYLRNKVIEAIPVRHPKYLKHYVDRSNQLALGLGLHIKSKKSGGKIKWLEQSEMILIYDESFTNNFDQADYIITSLVKKLSDQTRGSLTSQVKKIIKATSSGSYGPLLLSGNVLAYPTCNAILLLRASAQLAFTWQDKLLSKQLTKNLSSFSKWDKYSLTEFKHELETCMQDQAQIIKFPFWVAIKAAWFENQKPELKTKKIIHPLWPESTKIFMQREQIIILSGMRLMQVWIKNRSWHNQQLEILLLW